jgi:hypothetical protein
MLNDERNSKHEFQAGLAGLSFVIRFFFGLRHPSFVLPEQSFVFRRIPSL